MESEYSELTTLTVPKVHRTLPEKSRRPLVADHMHKGSRMVSYEYKDAETLLKDFDTGVNATLKKEGVET